MLVIVVAILLAFFVERSSLDREGLKTKSGWMRDIAEMMRRGDAYFDAGEFNSALQIYKNAMIRVVQHDKVFLRRE
jgi:hypothetical protein